MANSGEGQPPLGESNPLPAGSSAAQEIRFGSLRFQTCGDDYHMCILQEDPSNQPEPHQQSPAAPRRWSRPGPRARRARAARRAADVGDPHPTREGDVLQSGSQERVAPFLPGPMSASRATTVHSYPYGLRNSADAYASSIRTTMSAYGDQPGCHPASEQDFADPLLGDSRTESEDGHAFMRRHLGWDYSGLRDPEAFIAFQTAADYCFEYSDDEYDPTKECFVINDGQLSEGSASDDDGGGDEQGDNDGIDPKGAQPSDPSDHSPSEDERDLRHLPRASGDVSPPARSDREPAKQGDERGTDARHAGRVAQARILAEGRDDELAPRTSQKLIAAAALLRAMPEAATPEGRKLHLEAQKLVEHAARQHAESSASRLRRSSASKGERGGESSVRSPRPNGRARAQSQGNSRRDTARRHASEPHALEARTLPAREPVRSRLRDTRGTDDDGDARNTLNEIRRREGDRTHQRGRTDVGRNRDAAPEPTGTRVFSYNIRTAPIPPRFRQPTTITKYSGETDPRVWLNDYRLACQLGGATDDAMIIRNLPLHLADSARTWLEHLPPNRIRDWDDLVETFVGNFQGTYVRPGNTWDLRGCRQKPGESLRDFIRRFSKRCTELPNITDHQIIHSFLESTTCYSLVCKLGRSPPPDANRLFEIASKYASGEEAANAIFNDKKGKRPEEAAPRRSGSIDDLLKKPCPYHKTAVAHTLEQCEMLRKFYNRIPRKDSGPPKDGGAKDDDGYPEVEHVFFITGGPAANLKPRQQRRERREVMLVRPATPSYLDWSSETISFGREDHPDHIPNPGQYPLVVDPVIGNTRFSKVLMDGGSSLNILYAPTLELMGISTSELRPNKSSFHGVAPGKRVQTLGQIDLPVCFGTPANFRKEVLTFEVVGFKGAYHAILGRPCYAKFMAIPNYTYLKMKMPGPHGVMTVGPTVEHAYVCDIESIELAEALGLDETLVADLEAIVNTLPDANERQQGSFAPAEDTKTVPLDPDSPDGKEVVLVDCLRAHADIFAWSPSDMPGIPREVAEHSLDIRPHSKPVKQRLRRFDEVKRRAIGEEIRKLLEAGFIKEIKMKESDQLATSFITPFGMYCYVTMPFGLRNAGATYQRCMLRVFGDHIGRIVEAYVDDIVVKTRKADDLVRDLEVVFSCLRAHGVRLNSEKCVFGVPRGMLLGFIVSERGIEPNPDKVTAIQQMEPIRDLKGVQRVMGCLASLSRFISRLGEKGLPLYRLLRKAELFTWTAEAQEALDRLKTALTNTPILTSPKEGEPLLLYVAATTQVVSAVIVVERTEEGHSLPVQRPVYYISKVLSETKTRYPHIQKLIYAIVLARRKLRHYFEAYPVTVVSSFPLGEIIQNREVSGRISKWSTELMGETLAYAPRKAIKSQTLADFVAEWTDTQLPTSKSSLDCWEMYFDGSVVKTGAGAGLLFISPRGEHLRYVVRLNFPASNNMAEYKALLAGLKIALELGIKRLDIRGDSQLVVDQVMKESSCHDEKMAAYCQAVRKLEDKFDGLELHHIARRYNEEADDHRSPERLCQGHRRTLDHPRRLDPSLDRTRRSNLLADEDEPMGYEACSGDEDEAEAMEIDEVSAPRDWRSPYLDWLDGRVLPNDRTEARRVAGKAKRFLIIEGELYRRGASGVLQRCIPIPEGKELILDIHAGVCGHHAAPRTLVGNAFRQGFYWPTAVADATEVVRTCEGCQFYARKTHLPAQALQTIPITWPFAVWGLDLIGPMAKAPGGFTHLLVAIDKFPKWIEARPISRIKSEQAVLFFTDIIHRFGVPNSIITDNGTQFTGKKFLKFCDDFHIRVDWSVVAHPQTNGQVERANGMILQGLKPRIHNKLKKFGHKWSLRTTPSRATGFSPYFLVFGAEAILPTDLEYGSPRLRAYQEQRNCQAREDSLDQVDEARDVALLHSARYQQSLRRQQARRIRHRDLCKGDLVLRLRQDNRGRHKLSPPWEGPYIVAEVLKPGTYKLADEDGHSHPSLGGYMGVNPRKNRQGRLSRVFAYASRLRQHLTSLRLSHSRTNDPSDAFLSRHKHRTSARRKDIA
nr:unnamed protein product [Digitaria exilis]